ncbi:unnamed protein product [Adineta steineri]|uniref:Uncharacterized protein n=1 Tax=Adineta steineri TaxID=433720 RepID=A0A819XFW7_9BILA|nr:unnamed protein product [Adineta steineri]
MPKTNAERQKLYRSNLSKNKLKIEEVRKKARLRDNTRRKKLDAKSLKYLRLRQKQASKKYREKLKSKHLNNHQPSTYKCRQTLGKAVQRTLQSLPKDANKRHHVVHHIAQLLDVIPKPADTHKREQRSLSNELKKTVIQFYNRDDISYQMPGKRDCITVDNDNGQRITLQKRILLFSIREAHQLFLAENKHANISLSTTSFGELRPIHVLVQSHMSERNCLCSKHENVNLLLKSLSKHINCVDLNSLQAFSSALVCNEQNENYNETICIQVDFSENFHINVQDAIQSSFYSKDSVSLFTCYVWHLNSGQSYVYASDELSHDKYHVGAALNHLFNKLKNQFLNLKQVHVFSDGATQQFKQKFLFRNLCRLSERFKIDLFWHFFATAHGKGVVDGVGGTLKRVIYLAILGGQLCKSAADFVRIGQSKTTAIEIVEIEKYKIDDCKAELENLFQSLKPVPETKKIHSIKALTNNLIEYKYYSNSTNSKKYRFSV